jgi:preprotein translocase subunit SecG
MFYAVTVLYVLICFLLLLVVLLQRGKGGGMAAFGGGGTDTAFGARSGATLLTRATTILAALFMIVSLALGIMWRTGGGSVVSGVGGPAPVQAPAPQAPAPQTPQ